MYLLPVWGDRRTGDDTARSLGISSILVFVTVIQSANNLVVQARNRNVFHFCVSAVPVVLLIFFVRTHLLLLVFFLGGGPPAK